MTCQTMISRLRSCLVTPHFATRAVPVWHTTLLLQLYILAYVFRNLYIFSKWHLRFFFWPIDKALFVLYPCISPRISRKN